MKPVRGSRPRSPIESFPAPAGLRVSKIAAGEGELLVFSQPVEPIVMPAELTQAEADVARLIVQGEPNEAIAKARGTSLRTVANQVAAVFRKLGVASRPELVAKVVASER